MDASAKNCLLDFDICLLISPPQDYSWVQGTLTLTNASGTDRVEQAFRPAVKSAEEVGFSH
jgi:hypothetical protein